MVNNISFYKDPEAIQDWELICQHPTEVISGFLSIGKEDVPGLEEGGPALLGLSFARYMLRKFWHSKKESFQDYRAIFVRAIKAYSLSAYRNGDPNLRSRVSLDNRCFGWKKHLTVRMLGWVGKNYSKDGPFFEVIINSALNFNSTECYPFDAHILENKQVAETRADLLSTAKQFSGEAGMWATYAENLTKPRQFIQTYEAQHQKKPGPNAMRLLKGLEELDVLELKGQTTGNCWMKQYKRSVLVAIFIETLTHREELNPEQALKFSRKLYKRWTAFTRNELRTMAKDPRISPRLAEVARRKIEKKRP